MEKLKHLGLNWFELGAMCMVVRDHSLLVDLEDHVECQEVNLGQPHARQAPWGLIAVFRCNSAFCASKFIMAFDWKILVFFLFPSLLVQRPDVSLSLCLSLSLTLPRSPFLSVSLLPLPLPLFLSHSHLVWWLLGGCQSSCGAHTLSSAHLVAELTHMLTRAGTLLVVLVKLLVKTSCQRLHSWPYCTHILWHAYTPCRSVLDTARSCLEDPRQ